MSDDKEFGLDRIERLLEKSISASNRTTFAVRSLVGFVFIQLSFTTAAALLWNIAQSTVNPLSCVSRGENCEPIGFLAVIAVIVFVIGVIVSSSFAWSEFQKSDEESRPSVRTSSYSSGSPSKEVKVKCRVCRSSLDIDGKCSVDLAHKQF